MIADRTASQQRLSSNLAIVAKKHHLQLFSRYWALSRLGSRLDLSGLRYVIGHVTNRFPIGHLLSVVLWNQASIANGFRDMQCRTWRNGWHKLKRPLNKGEGHSFWYQSISHIRLPIGCQWWVLHSRTHRLATIHNVTDRQTDRRSDDDDDDGRNTVA